MDESDSDAASAADGNMLDDEENKYPFEGMYANEEEKEHIMSLREVDRESILAERSHEIELQRQNRLLRQLVSQNESDKKAAKKRKANDAELEEAQRKTSRQRTKVGGAKVGETSSGIESLRRARAERQDRKRRFDEDRERQKDKTTSASRDSPDDEDDRDNDSDLEWGGRNRRSRSSHTPEIKESPPADLRDIERVRLSRSRFAQICFFPGFESAMKGCFVRICIGPDAHGANVYRMAVIKGRYQLERTGASGSRLLMRLQIFRLASPTPWKSPPARVSSRISTLLPPMVRPSESGLSSPVPRANLPRSAAHHSHWSYLPILILYPGRVQPLQSDSPSRGRRVSQEVNA